MDGDGRISAATRVAAVIGHPIRHSLSPAIYNAAFAASGLDWVFVAFDVAQGGGADAVRSVRTLALEGLSVTMPHKDVAAATVDELSPRAATLGAVNCVSRRGATLVGDNTDGPGFVAALREDAAFDPAGARCVVLGAGGAARAIVVALADAGADSIVIVNRTAANAEAAAGLAPSVARTGTADEVDGADLVVNATSVGMADTGEPDARALPVDARRLGPGQVVADIVYHPMVTPLLAAAAERGALAVGGLGMLVHQAALSFSLWAGEAAPVPAMWAAARAGLASDG